MIGRLLPTLFYVGAGFILCLLCVAVYLAVAAYDNRRAARDAERVARPHSAHTGTAGQDAAAILHAAISTCPGCKADERTKGVIQLSALELYPPDHTCKEQR